MPARLETQVCLGPCGRELPLTWFHPNKRYANGRIRRCKDCINERRRRPGAVPRDGRRPDGTRRCSQCRIFKPESAYTKPDGTAYSGRYYVCDLCRPAYNREVWYRHRYGIDYDTFQRMLVDQSGRCGICNEEMTEPHLDHCHDTLKIRGLLCRDCNLAVGLLKDDPMRIGAMLLYIGSHLAS